MAWTPYYLIPVQITVTAWTPYYLIQLLRFQGFRVQGLGFYGFMVLWFYGFMVLWFYGFMVLGFRV